MLSTPSPTCIEEHALPRRTRREAGRLLAAEWGSPWRQQAHAGPYAPELRALAHNNADHVIAHVSAFAIPTAPSLALYGVGDLVVKPRYRGRNLAFSVSELLVEQCRSRGADAILVDTLAARHVFAKLGFRAASGFEFFYTLENRCLRQEHWMVWCGKPLAGAIELLEHGDF